MSKTKQVLIGLADKSTGRNIKATITLTSSLPFISFSQSAGPGVRTEDKNAVNDIVYNSGVFSKNINKRAPKNILVDADNPDRYIFIAIMSSYMQSLEMDVYYDTEEKDMFCIPSLLDMGDTPLTQDLLRNEDFNISGYGLGVTGRDAGISRICTAPYEQVKLGTPNPIDTKLQMLRIPGKPSTNANNQGLLLGGGDIYVETMNSIPTEFISFGSTATLGIKVPAYRYVRTAINDYRLFYVGMVDLDDVLVTMTL